MKNSKLRRVLLLLACAVMLVSLSVGATLAYLTGKDEVVNTFTVGNVQIKLDEAKVNTDGTYVTDHDNRVKANEYHLMPGHTYYKDPTVTVLAKSEDCYVRAFVTVENYQQLVKAFTNHSEHWQDDLFLLETVVDGWDRSQWDVYKADTATGVYEFRYIGEKCVTGTTYVDGGAADVVLDDLFESLTIPGYLTNAELAELQDIKITVTAQAIQADGFDTADLAWAQWID